MQPENFTKKRRKTLSSNEIAFPITLIPYIRAHSIHHNRECEGKREERVIEGRRGERGRREREREKERRERTRSGK